MAESLHSCFKSLAALKNAVLICFFIACQCSIQRMLGHVEAICMNHTACCAFASGPLQLQLPLGFCLPCTTCSTTRVCPIQVAGTHGTVRLDDFVIPYRPDKASFLVTNNHGLTKLDLQVKTETEERVVSDSSLY